MGRAGAGIGIAIVALSCGGSDPKSPRPDAGPTDAGGCAPEGATRACYGGPDGTLAIGTCASGVETCTDGVWATCDGATLPADEACDGRDEDCDGEVDDGVRFACGDCDASCEVVSYGPGEVAFDAAGTALDGAAVGGAGEVVRGGVRDPLHVLWTAGSGATVSRVDTSLRAETARYWAAEDWCCESPSAVAVDYEGNAYVANTGFDRSATVTRLRFECPDVDRDGSVETSDGRLDVREWGADECVDWSVRVGCGGGGCGTATAIAYETRVEGAILERAWVGLTDEETFVELDAHTGEETGASATCSPCRTSGAAIDRDGTLWAACGAGVCRFPTDDPESVEVLYHPPYNEAIAIDADGRAWIAGDVSVDDPLGLWTHVDDLLGHGVAIAPDGTGWIGACPAGDASGSCCRIDPVSLEPTVVPADLRLLAFDSDGMLWGFFHGAWVLDPATDEATPVLRDCDGPGTYCVAGPAWQSDLTGEALRLATDAPGMWRAVVPGCESGATNWQRLDWDADVAPGRAIRIEVRAASVASRLRERPWISVADLPGSTPPVSLEALDVDRAAPFLEVRATLAAQTDEPSPTLAAVRIHRSCR